MSTNTVAAPDLKIAPESVALMRDAIAVIEADPMGWDQHNWSGKRGCKTTFCLAGWAVRLAGLADDLGDPTPEGMRVWDDLIEAGVNESDTYVDNQSFDWQAVGQHVLGLTFSQGDWLFSGDWTDVGELKVAITRQTGITFP